MQITKARWDYDSDNQASIDLYDGDEYVGRRIIKFSHLLHSELQRFRREDCADLKMKGER